ncbi:MAG: glycosyltransferase family 2 protein [Pseudonocardiaceae bacterium]
MIPTLGAGTRVTVLLAHRDCTWGLERAVRSILGQTLDALQLVLIDDDSADTAGVQAIADACADPRLVALRTTRNVGQFRIYSRLLPAIASPLITYQDADDWSPPQRLETLAAALEQDGWDVLGSAVARRDRQGRSLPTFTPPGDVNSACAWRCRGGAVYGPTTLCRTEFVRRLGGYDGMTRFGADTDFAFRAVFAGRVGNLPQTLYEATVHGDSLTSSPSTGFGSAARRRYIRTISRRFYGNLLRSKLRSVALEHLQARPCNVDFDVVGLGT